MAGNEGFIGQRVTPSISHRPWVPVVEASVATAALAVPAPTVALPAAAVDVEQFPLARVMIGGMDAADETVNYQVVLWSRTVPGATSVAETYIPAKVAEGVATLGAAAQNSRFLADTITQTITGYGVQVHSPADNTVAFLEIDVRNAAWIEIEVDRGTAATCDVFVQLGEQSAGLVEISTGDLEIGAVEIKDHDGADRAAVDSSHRLAVFDDVLTSAPVEKTPVKVVQAVAVPSTAEALVGSETFARVLHLQARRVAGDNAGNVFVGLSDLDQASAELFELSPGDTFELAMPAGCKVDLNDIYVDADTATDGVVGWYLPV